MLAATAAQAIGRAFHLYDREDSSLPTEELFRPHATTKRWAFSHINVVIPDLPAPHRHLACMALLGRPAGPNRSPIAPLSEEKRQKLRAMLDKAGLKS